MRMLVLVRDLMFSSRITAEAKAEGVVVKLLRDPAALAGEAGDRLIVDLNLPAALEAAAQWKQRTGGAVVGFVAHVDTETIQQAQAAGLDQVLPRSRFVAILPQLLRGAV
jgi:DNA-binding NarL/FixJ family response regulator